MREFGNIIKCWFKFPLEQKLIVLFVPLEKKERDSESCAMYILAALSGFSGLKKDTQLRG